MRHYSSIVLFLSCLFFFQNTFGQVGIGTTTPNTNAILELDAASRGFLPPRFNPNTLTLGAAEEGMLVYNTAAGGLYFWDGASWQPVSTAAGDNWGTQAAQTDGSLTGDGTTANVLGIVPGTNVGEILMWDSGWGPQTIGGDVGGVPTGLTLQAIQGIPLNFGTLNADDVLTYDGNEWVNQQVAGDNLGNHVITQPMTTTLNNGNLIDLGDDARFVDVNAQGVVALYGQTDPSVGTLLLGNTAAFPEVNGSANGLTLRTDGNDRMRVDPTGNVGIGTTTPGHRLDVDGDALNRGVAWGNAGDIAYQYLGDSNHGVRAAFATGVTLFTSGAADGLFLEEGSGNVGIGEASPSQRLDVSGNARIDGDATITGDGTINGNLGVGTTPAHPLHVAPPGAPNHRSAKPHWQCGYYSYFCADIYGRVFPVKWPDLPFRGLIPPALQQ